MRAAVLAMAFSGCECGGESSADAGACRSPPPRPRRCRRTALYWPPDYRVFQAGSRFYVSYAPEMSQEAAVKVYRLLRINDGDRVTPLLVRRDSSGEQGF